MYQGKNEMLLDIFYIADTGLCSGLQRLRERLSGSHSGSVKVNSAFWDESHAEVCRL